MPLAVTEKVAVCPLRMDTLTGWVTITGATATPEPFRETENAELSCALVKEALPEALPAAVGANVAVNIALFPGFSVTGSVTPLRLKPLPEALA